jgi:tetratricopeptide (TPR) repeat protein
MLAPQGDQAPPMSPRSYRTRARKWSQTAWAASLLFGGLPLVCGLILGSWEFSGAAEISCLFLIVGTYLHFVSRRTTPPMPDPARMLDQASRLAASGRIDRAISLLTKTIRLNPQLWQAFQYRGELYMRQENAVDLAVRDFSEAIRLAPMERHLYLLRGHANSLLGDHSSSRNDFENAAAGGGTDAFNQSSGALHRARIIAPGPPFSGDRQ